MSFNITIIIHASSDYRLRWFEEFVFLYIRVLQHLLWNKLIFLGQKLVGGVRIAVLELNIMGELSNQCLINEVQVGSYQLSSVKYKLVLGKLRGNRDCTGRLLF